MGLRVMPLARLVARTVAVIGGGYAGLAAAITLAESGVRPVVFEAGLALGGRTRRIKYRGQILDNGQHILAGAYSELLRLMRLVDVPRAAFRRVSLRLSMPGLSVERPIQSAFSGRALHGLDPAHSQRSWRQRSLGSDTLHVGAETTKISS